MTYLNRYEDGETIFGVVPTADFILERVRSYSWKKAFLHLAQLAAIVGRHGKRSELVRRLTIDPLTQLTGDARAQPIIASARRAVQLRRREMVLAHEEAISWLQHLVLLEGGAPEGDTLGDAEVSLWLAAAGSHLGKWQQEIADVSTRDDLIAALAHNLRFNNEPDSARLLVRARRLFSRRPDAGKLTNGDAWERIEAAAFGTTYEEFFEECLGPIFLLSRIWGDPGGKWQFPGLNLEADLRETKLKPAQFSAFLEKFSATRDGHQGQIRKRLRPDGLPHAPTALLYRPLLRVDDVAIAASPWAMTLQLRSGVWSLFLEGARHAVPQGAHEWLRGFGNMLEHWCRDVAIEASQSPRCRATIQMPSKPGTTSEVEDVVAIEHDAAVLFSVKGRMMRADAGREAVSVPTTMKWYEDFFFEEKGDDFRGGAIQLLHNRIARIRAGQFEAEGVRRDMKLWPVVVTYDSLGETDLLYQWLEEQCRARGLLQGKNVGPITLARVDEYEELMARIAAGRSIVTLLKRRAAADRYRRLDQILAENALPEVALRLSFFEQEYEALVGRIKTRLFG